MFINLELTRHFFLDQVKQDDNKFEVTLDVSDYKPEELKVTTVNNVLSIEGRHEAKTEDSKDSGDARAFG